MARKSKTAEAYFAAKEQPHRPMPMFRRGWAPTLHEAAWELCSAPDEESDSSSDPIPDSGDCPCPTRASRDC